MSADIRKKLRAAIKKAGGQQFGVSPSEVRRAIYDVFVSKYGTEAVGDWSLYELKPAGYWTDERLLEDALRFNTRTRWANESSGYQAAQQCGIEFFERCCAHMNKPINQPYTDEEILVTALKFNSRNVWRTNSSGTYNAARGRGREFFNHCTSHMKRLTRNAYTEEELIQDARRFKSRKEWENLSGGAHRSALKRGKEFLDRCCAHMKAPQRAYTDEELVSHALRFSARTEWAINSPRTYNAARRRSKEFFELCCRHMKEPQKTYTDSELIADAKRFSTRNQWASLSPRFNDTARKRGKEFYESCCSHMTFSHKTYTDDELVTDASRFTRRKEWQIGSPNTYHAARNRGKEFLDRCCAHMKAPQRAYTDEELLADAKRFKTRSEWSANSGGANKSAQNRGKEFYDRCCSHMPKRAQRKKKV